MSTPGELQTPVEAYESGEWRAPEFAANAAIIFQHRPDIHPDRLPVSVVEVEFID